MRLIEALLKEDAVAKAIIMAGGAGAGKTHVSKQFIALAEENGWQYFNPDKYARAEDPAERLPLAAASTKVEKELGAVVTGEAKPNVVWDTTANNESKVMAVRDNGYRILMIMVYSHPMAAFQANFERASKKGEDSLPTTAVFTTWIKSYDPQHVNKYVNEFGDNFLLIDNTAKPGVDMKMIEDFNKAVESGPEAIERYITSIIESNPEKYTSTQMSSKPVDLPSEAQEAFDKGVAQANIKFKDTKEEEKLKKAALKYFENKNEPMPPAKIGRTNGMEETLAKIRDTEEKNAVKKKQMYVELHSIMKDIVKANSTVDDAVKKAKEFIDS